MPDKFMPLAEIRSAFDDLEIEAEESVELFDKRYAWIQEALTDISADLESVPMGTLTALVDASKRVIPHDPDVIGEDEDDIPEIQPRRKRPRVSTPKDKPRPRYAPPEKRKRPTHVVHRDAQPTEAQLRMVDKLIEQKGADAFLAACVDVEIQAHTTIRDRMTKWTRYQVSQLIKALLAS